MLFFPIPLLLDQDETELASLVIAGSSVIIALCAFWVTFWQGWSQRRHNRLSVRPYVQVLSNPNCEIGYIELRNDGVGPGLVKNFRMRVGVDGQILREPDHFFKYAESLGLARMYLRIAVWEKIQLLPGSSVQIVQLIDSSKILTFAKVCDSLQFDFQYESIYGELFENQ